MTPSIAATAARPGDILAYLNCDEQYLPGALKAVHDFFEAHPQIEVALAGTIVTDGEGKYICHRHSMVPHPQARLVPFPDADQFGFHPPPRHSRTRHFL